MQKTYVIYLHKNKINNKVYIGQTCQKPEKRWDYGCGYKRHNLHFYNAIQKYGWNNFEHIIIATDLSSENAKNMEIELINKYHTNLPQYGYNRTLGGDGTFGYKHKPESIQKK